MKVFLIGFMGSGKTHLGKIISNKLSIPFFDLDDLIVSREKKSITEIFASEGEEYFRHLEKDTLYLTTEKNENFVMACGGGTPCYFNNIDFMNREGATVWLNTSPDVLFERLLHEKNHRPLIKDLSDDQLKSYIIKKFADRKIFYEQAGIVVNDEPVNIESLLQRIFYV